MVLKDDHYTYRVTWSEEDQEYVGLCAEFPSLSWLAKGQEAALKGIRKLVARVVADLRAEGEPVPKPLATKEYSGKFLVHCLTPRRAAHERNREFSTHKGRSG